MYSWGRVTLVCALVLGATVVVVTSEVQSAAAHCHPRCDSAPPVVIDGDEVHGNIRAQYEALQNGGSGSGAEPPACDWTDENGEERDDGYARWAIAFFDDSYEHGRDPDAPKTGTYYRYECYHPDMGEDGTQQEPPGVGSDCGGESGMWICYFDAINPENLAMLAVDDFIETLGRPSPQLNPEETTLVNFDTWLWVDGIPAEAEEPQQFARMEVPDQWVETTGRVSGVEWDMGDGEDVLDCPVTTDAETAEQNCSYQYPRSSAGQPGDAYEGSAAVVWEVDYVGEIGGVSIGATISVRFEEPFEIEVAESQAIIVR